MTNETAVIYLENIGELLEYVAHKDYLPHYREALAVAKDALKSKSEAEEYRTPMKVVYKFDDSSDHTEVVGICPKCHGWEQLYDGERFCSECGQAIDWSKVGIEEKEEFYQTWI